LKAAIFDLDGTLVDSREDLFLAVDHALRELGLPPRSLEEVLSFVGEGASRLVSRAVAPHDHLADRALELWRSHYQAHLLDHTVLYPGLRAVLEGASATLAVHTNKPGDMARRILDGLGVLPLFAAVVGGDDAPRKPDPSGTLAILAGAGVPPEEAVFVGDSRVDVETAVAAGTRLVAVTWGLAPTADLARAGATDFAASASDLVPWLDAGR
jgi:phosphoglycolate phosphatase